MRLNITNPTRSLLCAAILLIAAPVLRAQYTPPPPPLTTAPCVPTKKDPCTPPASTTPPPAAAKFPFPGETTDTPATPAAPKAFPFPEDADKPAPPPASTPAAAKSFPFPDDADKPAPPSAPTPAAKSFPFPEDADKTSSSSSSSSSNADPDPPIPDDKPALEDKGSSGSTRAQRRHLPKVEDLDKREAEDLEVAHYYTTTGNFLAAYNRAKDAVATIPDDPLAHFALAEGARNLKKNDEALAEYKLYLKLDPEGEKAKAAQRALSQLSPQSSSESTPK
jgi:hypothetical protein